MKYYESSSQSFPTPEELVALGESIRKEFPNGPRISHTVMPDRVYTFNEIAQNIRVQQRALSASLYQ